MRTRLALLALGVVGAVWLSAAAAQAMSGSKILKKLNHDHDQTLEIPEVITAAAAMFNTLNQDHDLTLEAAETKNVLKPEEWKQFNTDGDSTLELDAWLTIARARFKAADRFGTGKLTAADLDTPAGQSLAAMLVK